MVEIEFREVLISIIVPVYNGERYIFKCLNSLLNQTLKEIEIIVVNDGSSDRTIEILRKLAKKDFRIKIINYKKNQGCSKARNIGIRVAKGKYLSFIDSDDYIDKDYYKVLYKSIEKNEADLVVCGIKEIENNKLLREVTVRDYKTLLDFACDENIFGFPVNKLYKKEIIAQNNIIFPEKISLSEDLVFNFRYLLKIKKVVSEKTIFYYYIKHSTNTTKNKFLYPIRYKALEEIINDILHSRLEKKEKNKIINDLIKKSFIKLNFYYLEELKIKKDMYWKELYIKIEEFYKRNKIYFSFINIFYYKYRKERLKLYQIKKIIRTIINKN